MRRAIFAIVTTVAGLVLLLSFKPHEVASAARPAAAVSGSGNGTGSGSTGSGSTGSGSTGTSGSQENTADSGSRTVTGDTVDTRWGPVQVQISVGGGKITSADVVQVPDENPRDREINSRAVPILNQEVLDAQSASIDTVSGATVTSEGYIGSLQSALDKAGL